jgi:hypothetical protein
MHWTPVGVPNNNGTATFDVTIDNLTVNLDIDPTITSLTMPGDAPFLYSTDHSMKIGATDEVAMGDIEITADQKDVKFDLGNFKAFSNKRLDETAWFIAVNAAAGRTATIQFNGADVVSNNGAPGFMGPGNARITDENGLDAFRNMTLNEPLGFLQIGPGAGSHYTVAKSVTNEGNFLVFDGGTLTFALNVTQVGDLRDPNDQQGGHIDEFSNTAATPARVIINGVLTNYDPATKTLHAGRYNLEGRNDGFCTFQVLGGALFDIVNNDASIALFGNGTFLDRNGADALRNLAISHRLRIANHDLTTAGSLTSSSEALARLAVRGNAHLMVAGDLTMQNGSLELSPLTTYDFTDPIKASQLKVKGNLSLASQGNIRFEVFGPDVAGTVDVTGKTTFAGALEIFVLPKAPLLTSGSLTLLTSAASSGQFSNVPNGRRVTAYAATTFDGQFARFNGVITGTFKTTYDNNSLVISDFQLHAGMLNISTRLKVQTGDNVAIAGFIVNGIGPKKMIVRGIGPSLTSKGVPGALADPVLELYDSAGAVLQTNDNWQDDATEAAAITATGIAPSDPKESAIVATLDPGMYTAVLRGANNTSGIGLIEAYDLNSQRAPSEFANLSTRGRIETGDNVMIGGVIIGAPEPAQLIVRAIGPSLASNGVADPLQDPTLELHDASGAKIRSDDNWQDDAMQVALLRAAGLAPSDTRESALAVTLSPGNYTAIVRGKNNSQGVALVEFYKLN